MSDEPSGSAAGPTDDYDHDDGLPYDDFDDDPPPADLDHAEQFYRQHIQDGFRILNDHQRNIKAAGQAEQLILQAGKKVSGWGRLKNQTLRSLGQYLNRTPRLKGRPKKESDADSLPSLADLGVKSRHVAADAIKAAKVPQAVFDDYQRTSEPTFRGLLRYADVERLRHSVDPIQQRVEDDIRERGKTKRSKASEAKTEAVSRLKGSRISALKGSLSTLLHPNTGPEERVAAALAVEKLFPTLVDNLAGLVQRDPDPIRPASGSYDEYREQLAQRDDLIVEQRKIINELKRGKGDPLLKKAVAALRKENAALNERVADLEQTNLDLHNQRIAAAADAAKERDEWKARALSAESRLAELESANADRPAGPNPSGEPTRSQAQAQESANDAVSSAERAEPDTGAVIGDAEPDQAEQFACQAPYGRCRYGGCKTAGYCKAAPPKPKPEPLHAAAD